MNKKIIRNIILSTVFVIALFGLSLSNKKLSNAATSTPLPAYTTDPSAQPQSISINYNIGYDASLGTTGAKVTGPTSGTFSAYTASLGNVSFTGTYNTAITTGVSGANSWSNALITSTNIDAIVKGLNFVIDGTYTLTKYVPYQYTLNGANYTGYLESTTGQTVPNLLIAVNVNATNGQDFIKVAPGFNDSSFPKGDGQQSSGAMADFSVNMQQSIQGATNWIGLSNFNPNVDSMNFGLNGHTMTLTGKTTISNVDASYSVTLDVETVKASSIGDTSCSDPSALDFHVTTTSATVNGVSVNPSLVLNALYAITKQHNSFVTYSGGNDFYLSVYEMPGGQDLNAGDNYGTTTWKTNRILVGVNWSTGTFYYDYTDNSGQRNVPMDLGD